MGCYCGAHGEDSNEEEESEVFEDQPNTELIVEVAPVEDVITAEVDHVNRPVQLTYEETLM